MGKVNDLGIRQQNFAKGEYLPMESDDLNAVLELGIKALGRSRAKYQDNEDGYNQFIENSRSYLEYVQDVNRNPDIDKKLIVDIEGWCVWCGITRETLRAYKNRGGAWQTFIDYFKEIIVMCKKQLAFTYKIPPMIATFDLVNNHGYRNTNEFRIADERTIDNTPKLTKEELIYKSMQLPDNDYTEEELEIARIKAMKSREAIEEEYE